MKCPNDQTEMEKGLLAQNGDLWVPTEKLGMMFFSGLGKVKRVRAYHCPECGKVELKTEDQNDVEKEEEK